MATEEIKALADKLRDLNKRIDEQEAARPTSTPTGTPTNPNVTAIFRQRLGAGGVHFVERGDGADNRRRLHTVDRAALGAVDATEPASAAAARKDLDIRRGKMTAAAQARRDLERARSVLEDTAHDKDATHADLGRWQAEVRRLARASTAADTAASTITRADCDQRQNALDTAIDRHRETVAGQVLDRLAEASPFAVAQADLQRASDHHQAMTGAE